MLRQERKSQLPGNESRKLLVSTKKVKYKFHTNCILWLKTLSGLSTYYRSFLKRPLSPQEQVLAVSLLPQQIHILSSGVLVSSVPKPKLCYQRASMTLSIILEKNKQRKKKTSVCQRANSHNQTVSHLFLMLIFLNVSSRFVIC